MNFEKNLLSQGQAFFTQDEFNKALSEYKDSIIKVMSLVQESKKQSFQYLYGI